MMKHLAIFVLTLGAGSASAAELDGGDAIADVTVTRPPAADPAHHYHVQVFALDRKLTVSVGADRDELLQEIEGHVLAKGELVGLLKRPDRPAKP